MAYESENTEVLDEEFKVHIREIQPYFKTFKWTNYELRLCRAWLYKLFQVDQYQISLRNVYTNELMKQLKSGELSEPFDKFPQDKEPLIPLTTYRPTNNNNYNEMENTEVHTSVSENMLNFPTNIVVHKYTENEENYEEVVLKEIQMEDDFDSKRDIIEISADNSKEIQRNNTTLSYSERGDVSIVDHETKIKLDTIEELKIKIEILEDQVQRYADITKLHDDRITKIHDELSVVKNDVDKIYNWKATLTEDLNNLKMFADKSAEIENRISQLEVNNLKETVKYECENGKCMKDMIELLKNIKEQHCLEINENQRRFNEQVNKLEHENEQLKNNTNIEAEEFNSKLSSLEEHVIIQNLSIDYYKKSLKEVLRIFDN